MNNETKKPQRHIKEITAEFKPFWEPLFNELKINPSTFGAKLGYYGREFGTREPLIRFFPSELSSGNDFITELFDWDQYYFTPNHRILYRLPYNPNWKSEPDKYAEITPDKSNLPTSTFAVRLSDFEILNKSDVKSLIPVLNNGKPIQGTINASLFDSLTEQTDPFNEESFDEAFTEKEDNHYTSMTVRDIYCMIQNVPMSNKKWLNQLISKNNK